MPAALKTDMTGSTLVLTISHPERRNALDPCMYAAGIEALNAAESSRDVRAVVITGEAMCFSSGGNLQRLANNHKLPECEQSEGVRGLHGWIEAIQTSSKPVIAAVEGVAAGAGFSIALACDFLIASETSRFSIAHSRMGLSPDGGATWFLTRALPKATALYLMMSGSDISARRLWELGAITQLAPEAQALPLALQVAANIAKQPEATLASIKELAVGALRNSLPDQLHQEQKHFLLHLRSHETRQRIDAFLAKVNAR